MKLHNQGYDDANKLGGTRTQCDETAEEPWPHSVEIILRKIFGKPGYEEGGSEKTLTLDWNVNSVKPRKTPTVISLIG